MTKIRSFMRDGKYADYKSLVGVIIKASGPHVSRNSFDHILWHCFKGDAELKKKTNALVGKPESLYRANHNIARG